jgi:uncharacterized cupredoxin-like copper-binding protein
MVVRDQSVSAGAEGVNPMVFENHAPGLVARRGVVLVAAAVLLVGCSAGASPSPRAPASQAPASVGAGTSVTAALTEFKIELSATTAPAGPVTFALTNSGTVVHEFVVFKTDLAADKLPLAADGATVDEEGAGPSMTLVDEVEDIAVGATASLAVDLPAAHYVVICNVATHYTGGMRAEFTTN